MGVQTKTNEQIVSSSAYNAKVRSKLNGYIGGTSTSIAGVYIFTNLKTGEQNVESSINLYTRLRSYFKPSILNEGNRLINQSMKTFLKVKISTILFINEYWLNFYCISNYNIYNTIYV